MVYFMNKILREIFLLGQRSALHAADISLELPTGNFARVVGTIVGAEPLLIKANEELKNKVREVLMVGPLSEVEKRIEELF
jgi:hypothetical protein